MKRILDSPLEEGPIMELPIEIIECIIDIIFIPFKPNTNVSRILIFNDITALEQYTCLSEVNTRIKDISKKIYYIEILCVPRLGVQRKEEILSKKTKKVNNFTNFLL